MENNFDELLRASSSEIEISNFDTEIISCIIDIEIWRLRARILQAIEITDDTSIHRNFYHHTLRARIFILEILRHF